MLTNKNKNYNPKIDFLVCKNLINNLPNDYDEILLRDAYKNYKISNDYCSKIIDIKKYFLENDLISYSKNDIENLYFIITDKKIELTDDYVRYELNITNLKWSVNNIKNMVDVDKYLLIRILIVFYSLNNMVIIPYRNHIKQLYLAVLYHQDELLKNSYNRLINRTKEYLIAHDNKENEKALLMLDKYKKEFVESFNALEFGIYGSFSTKSYNEYSDLDMYVLMKNIDDKKKIKTQILKFWNDKFNIKIDLKLVTLETIDTTLTKNMKKSKIVIFRR